MSDILREEFVQAIRERAHDGKDHKAFVEWYVDAVFGRVQWSFTDDSGDGGIDALVWLPDERPSVVVIQSKYSERPGRSLLNSAAYRDFSEVVGAFRDDEEFEAFIERSREDVRSLYRKAQAKLAESGHWATQKKAFRLITTCRRRGGGLEDGRIPSSSYVYADDVLELYGSYRKGQTPRANDLALKVSEKLSYRDPQRRVESYVFNSRVSDFRKYFERNDVARLVARNIRYNLGGKVGKEIRKTYEAQPHDFWYVHNGITVVCDACVHRAGIVVLKNPSVINGAQTLYAIASSHRKSSPAFVTTRVVVRAAKRGVAHEDDAWVQGVIRGVNTQNRVKSQDFRSNEPEQIELQNLFRDRKVFYERKRGEWREVRNDPRYRGFSRTSLRSIGIALRAFSEKDGSGVVGIKRSVDDVFDMPAYGRLFPARSKIGRKFEHIYLSYRIMRFVRECGYTGVHGRKQRHAFWTTAWLFHRGVTNLQRFHSRASVDSIARAFDAFEGPGKAGASARALLKRLREAVWRSWRTARKSNIELWTANNFFKSTWGHKRVSATAMPRLRDDLRKLGQELLD